MTDKTLHDIAWDGLWKNNPALVQLLGLCPLLAVTGSVVNAIGLGIATMIVLIGSNISVSLIRHFISPAIRLPAFVMIIASFVTVTELLIKAYAYDLFLVLGIFIPLIVTNCAILGRADGFAAKNSVSRSAFDGFMMGLGFALVLIVLGAIRELIGQGTLFSDMDILLGPIASNWTWIVFTDYQPFLFAILPPGAFIAMGLIIAFKNWLDQYYKRKSISRQTSGSKRVRVTGKVS